MKSKSDLGFRFFELKLAFYHSVLFSLNLWGKVRTMMTLGAKSASSESTKNTVGKALTLCALVFKTALHSSWICTKSMEDKDAERVRAFWAWGVLNRIWSGLGVRPGGWPSRLGGLLLIGRMAMRCLAAAWFSSTLSKEKMKILRWQLLGYRSNGTIHSTYNSVSGLVTI